MKKLTTIITSILVGSSFSILAAEKNNVMDIPSNLKANVDNSYRANTAVTVATDKGSGKWYMGLGILSRTKSGDHASNDRSNSVGTTSVVQNYSTEQKEGGTLFLGYKSNHQWGAEIGYIFSGRENGSSSYVSTGTGTGNRINLEVSATKHAHILTAAGLYWINVYSYKLNMFFKLGFNYNYEKEKGTHINLGNPPMTDSETRHFVTDQLGIGLQYDIKENFGIRLEANMYGFFRGIGNYMNSGWDESGVATDCNNCATTAGVSYNDVNAGSGGRMRITLGATYKIH